MAGGLFRLTSICLVHATLGAPRYVVAGADLNGPGLEETKRLIENDGGVFTGVIADVGAEQEVASFLESVTSTYGAISAAVACAGIASTKQVHEETLERWNEMISVNLTGPFLLAKHVMPIFMANKAGAFVAVSSEAGVRAAAGYGAYCASKHGVLGLVRRLALDYGQLGIRSNVVCPGFVQTEMMDRVFAEASDLEQEKKGYEREVPLGRFAAPEEVAAVIKHLCSEEASYSNGMIYAVDGGVTAGHLG